MIRDYNGHPHVRLSISWFLIILLPIKAIAKTFLLCIIEQLHLILGRRSFIDPFTRVLKAINWELISPSTCDGPWKCVRRTWYQLNLEKSIRCFSAAIWKLFIVIAEELEVEQGTLFSSFLNKLLANTIFMIEKLSISLRLRQSIRSAQLSSIKFYKTERIFEISRIIQLHFSSSVFGNKSREREDF